MERILLLEDDKSLVTGLTLALGRAGYALDMARTLAEAGHLWQAGRYDLLMLDVTLPDGTGFDFCQKVRRTSGVPILFLTASDEEMDIITGLDLGGDDYITKPFKLGVLLSRVHALLQAGTDDAENVRELAELSEQELDRMEQLVQSLLKLTRLDAGTVQLEKTEQDLQGLLEQTARPFACRARQEQKQLAVTAEQGVCLCCDRVWMSEAVGNLIKNALNHTRTGDTVTVEGSRFADFVRIRVVDTGTGIHPEDLPHLFKRFYRSRFAQDTPGIGLGLPLAKSIVEAHGGTLEVESEPGRGATFTILLRNRPVPAIPTKL